MLFLQRASRTCLAYQHTANRTRAYHIANALCAESTISNPSKKAQRKRKTTKKYSELPESPSIVHGPLGDWNGGLGRSQIVDSRGTSSSHTCALFVASEVQSNLSGPWTMYYTQRWLMRGYRPSLSAMSWSNPVNLTAQALIIPLRLLRQGDIGEGARTR